MNDELKHYGILGQKWGVRRFQNKDGTLTPAGRKRVAQNRKHPTSKDFVESKRNMKVSNLTGMSPETVKAAKVTVNVAFRLALPVITAYGFGVVRRQVDRVKRRGELEELKNHREITSFDKAPKLKQKMSPAKSMKVTNPGFPNEPGTSMNCTFCTTAMALREKGYNVAAQKLADGMYGDILFKSAFNSPTVKMSRRTTATSMLDTLSANGEGSYGNLTIRWKLGGGHSIFWKVENGKTHIYDAQCGSEYTESFATLKSFTDNVKMSNIEYNRLDNCEPTQYALGVVKTIKK